MAEMDERYATFREHAELRERTATMEATVQQIPIALARLEQAVQTVRTQPDHHALSTHRVLDELPQIIAAVRQQSTNGQQVSPLLMGLAIIGAMAIGALGYRFLTGG